MTWNEHIRDNKDNLLKSLNARLGDIRKIRNLTSFKNRKMIAEGILISKLSYIIALWGGCGTVLRKSLQVIRDHYVKKLSPEGVAPLWDKGIWRGQPLCIPMVSLEDCLCFWYSCWPNYQLFLHSNLEGLNPPTSETISKEN